MRIINEISGVKWLTPPNTLSSLPKVHYRYIPTLWPVLLEVSNTLAFISIKKVDFNFGIDEYSRNKLSFNTCNNVPCRMTTYRLHNLLQNGNRLAVVFCHFEPCHTWCHTNIFCNPANSKILCSEL